jgi:PAS domain S-box-containing protein
MNNRTVLVVDDDESVAEYIETALKLKGYEVVTAHTATQALGKIKSDPARFAVVLSDIMMPGVNGLELLKFIRQSSPDTIVVMMTAHSSMDTAIQALNEGAFAYLRKPVSADELNKALAGAFARYDQAENNRAYVKALAAEKEYNETVLQNLVYLVVATDAAGNIKKVNKAVEYLLGYAQEQLLGQPLSKILSPANQQAPWEGMQSSKSVNRMQLIFRSNKGEDINVAFSGTIMRDDKGAIVGFLGTAQPTGEGEKNA